MTRINHKGTISIESVEGGPITVLENDTLEMKDGYLIHNGRIYKTKKFEPISSGADMINKFFRSDEEINAAFLPALNDHVAACNRFEAAQRELEDARKAVEAARDAVRAAV